MLELQARSFAHFADPNMVGRIRIVVEDADPVTSRSVAAIGDRSYGKLGDHVEIVKGGLPQRDEEGWWRQQCLKLTQVAEMAGDPVVVLDCKNHFVRPASTEAFLKSDGRLRASRARQFGPLVDLFDSTARYFGLSPNAATEETILSSTPFPLRPDIVSAMIASIEDREARPFGDFFLGFKGLTEFFSVYCYLESGSDDVEKIYSFGPPNWFTLYGTFPATESQIVRALKTLTTGRELMLGVHRKRYLSNDPRLELAVVERWVSSGLLSTPTAALDFIRSTGAWIRQALSDRVGTPGR